MRPENRERDRLGAAPPLHASIEQYTEHVRNEAREQEPAAGLEHGDTAWRAAQTVANYSGSEFTQAQAWDTIAGY